MSINLRRECDICSGDGIVKFGTDLQPLCVKLVFSIWFDGGDVFNHGNHVNFVIDVYVHLWRMQLCCHELIVTWMASGSWLGNLYWKETVVV
jgi:hypothetical protein